MGKIFAELGRRGYSQMSYFILDIDSTIGIGGERIIFYNTTPKNYRAAEAGAIFDEAHQPILLLAKMMVENGHDCVVLTARGESAREITTKWLESIDLKPKIMYLRNKDDFRPDYVIKSEKLDEIIETYNGELPLLAFDDRQDVIDMMDRRGIPTCMVRLGRPG